MTERKVKDRSFKELLKHAMVQRFLSWRLPDGFSPDCYISFDEKKARDNLGWPTGTNLLNAEQAMQMIEHIEVRSSEHAWVIEVTSMSDPYWFTTKLNFIADPYQAIRFDSKEDADNFISLFIMPNIDKIKLNSNVTFAEPFVLQSIEHIFLL